MEQRFSWQAPTEFEICFGTIYNLSPESSATPGLWTSTSCSNLISDDDLYISRGESSDKNFIYNSPERQLYSLENGEEPIFSSDFQQNDLLASLLAKNTHQQREPNTMIPGVKSGGNPIPYGERSSMFVKWNGSPFLPCLKPQKSQALHKRCISFLKCINDHRMSQLDESHGGSRVNKHDDYDKLAIHHVVAERKRREQMNQMFSALRSLLPINPKKGRAPVLLQTIDYVAHLKQRVEQLERRNGELEAFLQEKSHH